MLGDRVAEALDRIGITPDRVSRWVGAPCGCEERKAKLNALDLWARRVVSGRVADARRFLEQILGGADDRDRTDG